MWRTVLRERVGALRTLVCDCDGQSSVEYALVMIAFLSTVAALACLWHAGRDGQLLRRAIEAASHQLGGGDALGEARDIALF